MANRVKTIDAKEAGALFALNKNEQLRARSWKIFLFVNLRVLVHKRTGLIFKNMQCRDSIVCNYKQ